MAGGVFFLLWSFTRVAGLVIVAYDGYKLFSLEKEIRINVSSLIPDVPKCTWPFG